MMIKKKKKPHNYPTTTPPVEEETDQVTTKYRPSNDEVIDEENLKRLTSLQLKTNKTWDNFKNLEDETPTPIFIEDDNEETEEVEELKNKRLVYRKYD